MKWNIAPQKEKNIIDQLLVSRGVPLKNKEKFLNPQLTDLYDPFKLPDLKETVQLIEKAQRKEWSVGIFADYDADGIPGAVLLAGILDRLDINWYIYIPTRSQGYGVNQEGVEYFIQNDCRLMITVDCGISDHRSIKLAKEKGLKVAVLDHHEPKSKLPSAEAVVDAKRKDSSYPDSQISAGAVVFKLGQALLKEKLIKESFLKRSLDLVGISVITDMVPLLKENRILAYYGLIALRKTRNIGLQELYKVARIKPNQISPYTVGFQIGPRINAPGRMDHGSRAFYLLASQDRSEASQIALELNKINQNRQDILEEIYQKALEIVKKDKLDQKPFIIVQGENWPKGLVGLVAGRLVEKYNRPSIVLSGKNGKLEGSARSISSFHLLEALEESEKHLIQFGGHSQAAGLKLKKEELKDFYNDIAQIADQKLTKKDLKPELKIDCKLSSDKLTGRFARKLAKLAPHGISNPRPVFMTDNFKLVAASYVGRGGNHAKLTVKKEDSLFDCIGFNLSDRVKSFNLNERIDLAYGLEENTFNGKTNLQLVLKDLKKASNNN